MTSETRHMTSDMFYLTFDIEICLKSFAFCRVRMVDSCESSLKKLFTINILSCQNKETGLITLTQMMTSRVGTGHLVKTNGESPVIFLKLGSPFREIVRTYVSVFFHSSNRRNNDFLVLFQPLNPRESQYGLYKKA